MIDLEKMSGAKDGLCGSLFSGSGLLRLVAPEQRKIVLQVADQEKVTIPDLYRQ